MGGGWGAGGSRNFWGCPPTPLGVREVVGEQHGRTELEVALEALEGGRAQAMDLQPIGEQRGRQRRRIALAAVGRAGEGGGGRVLSRDSGVSCVVPPPPSSPKPKDAWVPPKDAVGKGNTRTLGFRSHREHPGSRSHLEHPGSDTRIASHLSLVSPTMSNDWLRNSSRSKPTP